MKNENRKNQIKHRDPQYWRQPLVVFIVVVVVVFVIVAYGTVFIQSWWQIKLGGTTISLIELVNFCYSQKKWKKKCHRNANFLFLGGLPLLLGPLQRRRTGVSFFMLTSVLRFIFQSIMSSYPRGSSLEVRKFGRCTGFTVLFSTGLNKHLSNLVIT